MSHGVRWRKGCAGGYATLSRSGWCARGQPVTGAEAGAQAKEEWEKGARWLGLPVAERSERSRGEVEERES
jgi:hypothetical protein